MADLGAGDHEILRQSEGDVLRSSILALHGVGKELPLQFNSARSDHARTTTLRSGSTAHDATIFRRTGGEAVEAAEPLAGLAQLFI